MVDRPYYNSNLKMAWINYKKKLKEKLSTLSKQSCRMENIVHIKPYPRDTGSTKHQAKTTRHFLSPLIFIMAIVPLSKLPDKSNTGYNLRNRQQQPNVINHLLYMDDLKLYASNQN